MSRNKIRPAGAAPALAGATRRLFTRPDQKNTKSGLQETTGSWLALIAKLGLLYGGAWLFSYCFFAIGFFPSGIGAADSIFLLFVAASFGVVVLLVAALGLNLIQPWLGMTDLLIRDRGKRSRKFLVVGSATLLSLVCLAATLARMEPSASQYMQFEQWAVLGGLALTQFAAAYYVKRLSEPKSDVTDGVGSGVLSVLCLVVTLMLVLVRQWWAVQFVLIQGMLAAGLLMVWRTPPNHKDRGLGILILSGLNLFAPIYVSVLLHGNRPMSPTFSLTFERLGLYRDAADVIVSNKAAQQVRQLGTEHGVGLQSCLLDDGALLVSRVQVLWHGVGTRSLLRIPDVDTNTNASLTQRRIELNAADVRLLSTLPQQCAQLPTEIHFASKSAQPLDSREIDELNESFREAAKRAPKGWLLTAVKLRGHADPMPLAKDGNLELGLARAKAVGTELVKQFDLAESVHRGTLDIEVESSASRSGRSEACPFKGDHALLEECHARSRRVEVRLIFKPFEAQADLDRS